MKIIVTGLTGLVGSRIHELLGNFYEFENLSRSSDINIENKDQVFDFIQNSDAPIVLHLAAKTNVDECEQNKDGAWKINVLGTKNVVDACNKTRKKIIYVSTDFVFDGEKEKPYTEEDDPNPINWYGQTKYEGERIVRNATVPWLIMRIAYPYRAKFEKKDFMRAILERLRTGQKVQAVTDHIFTPTFIDDITKALDTLIQSESTGIFHIVGYSNLSPYEASLEIAEMFGLNSKLISKTTRKEYFKNGAQRPFKLALLNDKIGKLGVYMRSFKEGLEAIKKQL